MSAKKDQDIKELKLKSKEELSSPSAEEISVEAKNALMIGFDNLI